MRPCPIPPYAPTAPHPIPRAPPHTRLSRPYTARRLVLASDGMWDVMTEGDVAKAIKGVDDPHIAARKLTKLAHKLRM